MRFRMFKVLSFGSLAAVIVMMMAATVLEKLQGTSAALRLVYHSPVFIALWAVGAVTGLVWLLSRGVAKRRATLLLHLALVLILAGALVTHLTGVQGRVHLRVGESAETFVDANGREHPLPFWWLQLDDFKVEYYDGSAQAADYVSKLTFGDGKLVDSRTVSMNRIFRWFGYRFYQSGYDEDLRGVWLSVNHDPAGIGVTYAGYLLLLLSMIGFFFEKDSGFRQVLRRIRSAAPLLLLLLLPQRGLAAGAELPPALPAEVAEQFGELYVYYNDRVAPMQTLARDYCLKAYGKAHYGPYSAEQVVSGWLFYYDWWKDEPFKLKAREAGTEKEFEKEAVRMSAASGRAFKIFPIAFADSLVAANPGLQPVVWFHCDEPLPEGLEYDRWVFIRRSLDLLHDEVRAENWPEVSRLLAKIRQYQEKEAGAVLPPTRKIRAERFYNRISRPMVPFMASITLGILVFVLSGILMARGRQTPRWLQRVLAGVALLLFCYLTVVLGLRWYVSGHAPFAGSYSVMLLMAWLSALAMLLLWRRFALVQPLGLILAGFTMLLASLASANPQITHLMPVLQSPLLSIHVLAMMVSYTLFGLVALNGMMGLFLPAAPSERLRDVSLLILYPAVFLLTFGTFLGAVWANISWGSYWSWDPKETWALVTVLIYAAALHGGSLAAFRRPRFFHVFCILAFLAVLVTYFGVNLFLGGMHSYS